MAHWEKGEKTSTAAQVQRRGNKECGLKLENAQVRTYEICSLEFCSKVQGEIIEGFLSRGVIVYVSRFHVDISLVGEEENG